MILIVLLIAFLGWIMIDSVFWAVVFEIVYFIAIFFLMSMSDE